MYSALKSVNVEKHTKFYVEYLLFNVTSTGNTYTARLEDIP
jgi:hypothetical protein